MLDTALGNGWDISPTSPSGSTALERGSSTPTLKSPHQTPPNLLKYPTVIISCFNLPPCLYAQNWSDATGEIKGSVGRHSYRKSHTDNRGSRQFEERESVSCRTSFLPFLFCILEFSRFFLLVYYFSCYASHIVGDGVPKGSVVVTFYVFFLMIWHPFLLSLQTVT